MLPIPDRKPVTLTTYTAKDPDTKFPPIRQLRPPAGAPNVLIVLIDDTRVSTPRRGYKLGPISCYVHLCP